MSLGVWVGGMNTRHTRLTCSQGASQPCGCERVIYTHVVGVEEQVVDGQREVGEYEYTYWHHAPLQSGLFWSSKE